MLKGAVALMAAVVTVGAIHAQEAQTPESAPGSVPEFAPDLPPRQEESHQRLSQADLNALMDARIAMAKAMLDLTPEQQSLWPPIEEALRNGAELRYRHMAQVQAMASRSDEADPVAMIRNRADTLNERGAQLKKLAEAWQPLYQTLTPDQKDRLRLVASYVLHETRNPERRAEDFPEDESGDDD